MKRRKKNRVDYTLLYIAGIIATLILLFVAVWNYFPAFRWYILHHDQKATEDVGFVDRLKGTDYSKDNFDGIDVAKHQGVILWDEVVKNYNLQFVYIRATMGKRHPDKNFERNLREAKKVGLKVGAYHFLTSKCSIDDQFNDFYRYAKPLDLDLIPMLDVEASHTGRWSREELQDSVAKFSALVKRYYGCLPMIYSNESFYNDMLAPRFNDHILYIANYNPTKPKVNGRGDPDLWQFTEHGHLHGIGEWVDLCRFCNGTTLEKLLISH